MEDDAVVRLETPRLTLHEVESSDLEAIHAVFASNPDFLARRHGASRADDGYGLAAVTHYWEEIRSDPGRHLLAAIETTSGKALGVVDFVEESPFDDLPWIGLVLVDGTRHREGFGSEIVSALTQHLASLGHDDIRMAVVQDNAPARAFALSLGFVDIGDSATSATGDRIILYGAPLSRPSASS